VRGCRLPATYVQVFQIFTTVYEFTRKTSEKESTYKVVQMPPCTQNRTRWIVLAQADKNALKILPFVLTKRDQQSTDKDNVKDNNCQKCRLTSWIPFVISEIGAEKQFAVELHITLRTFTLLLNVEQLILQFYLYNWESWKHQLCTHFWWCPISFYKTSDRCSERLHRYWWEQVQMHSDLDELLTGASKDVISQIALLHALE